MLRSFGSRALTVGILAIAASGMSSSSGCSITKPTEVVPGALSQIEVPENLAGLRVQVKANGSVKYDQTAAVTKGVALLPATLGVVSGGTAETTVTVIVAGYNQAAVLNGSGEYNNGSGIISEVNTTMGSSPSVRRTSVLTYVNQRTLFLPMQLSYSCWNTQCSPMDPEGSACKANTCTTSSIDSSTLVDFDPSLVDGTQDCFSPSQCFSPVTTAVLLDAKKCLYEVPPDQVTGLGLNVRILYQDLILNLNPATNTLVPQTVPTSEQEILSEENQSELLEGFSIPDPAKPEQFQLAPGLCTLVGYASNQPTTIGNPSRPVKAGDKYHTISAVQVSTTCPSKLPLLPICAAEQNVPAVGIDGGPNTNLVCDQPITLDPVPSAVYMVMDNSSIMSGAFGPQGYATAMGLSLGNPVFKRTYVAFDFLDHNPADCTTTTPTSYMTLGKSGTTSLDFTLANVGQPTVAGFLGNVTPPDPGPDGGVPPMGFAPLYLQPAMRLDVGVYKHLQDFTSGLQESPAIAAAMFFINRQPDSTGAGDAGDLMGAADLVVGVPNSCNTLNPPLPAGTTCTVPGGVDCSPALDTPPDLTAQNALVQQIVAADKAGLQSYFVILNNSLYQVGTPLQYFQQVQTLVKAAEGGSTTMQVLDATQPKADIGNVLGTFSNVVTPLGTCLYELPPGVGTDAKVTFTIPIPTLSNSAAPAPVPVPYNANCNATNEATQSGWNIEGPPGAVQHLRICGSNPGGICWELRTSVLAVSAATLAGSGDGGVSDAGAASIPEVPVTVTLPCADAGP
jgi:hypothetical protein